MHSFARYLLLTVAGLLLLVNSARGQDEWDAVLDRYERIAQQCLDLRSKVAAGEAVADRSLAGLLQELSQLRSTLQGASGSMSPAQRKRFARIRDNYARAVSAGDGNVRSEAGQSQKKTTMKVEKAEPVTPATPVPADTHPAISPLPILQPMKSGFPAGISYAAPVAVFPRPKNASGSSTLPAQNEPAALHGFVLTLVSLSSPMTFGGMAGLSGRRLGFYASGRSSFSAKHADYTCMSDGAIDGGGRFWGDGQTGHLAWIVSAGPVVRLDSHLSLYAGAGIGERSVYWHDSVGKWAQVSDLSGSGLALDAGIQVSWHHLALSAGISWLHPTRQATPSFGIGLSF